MTEYRTAAVFAPMFPPAFLGGGPIRTLDALVREAPRHWNIVVLTSDRDLNEDGRLPVPANAWVARGAASIYYMSTNRVLQVVRGFVALGRAEPDVIYLNSFFNPLFSLVPQLLSRTVYPGRPTRVLAPRGELSEGALAIKSRKKKYFIRVFKSMRLDRGIVWHASSELEAADIQRVFGRDTEILVRENETSLPMKAADPIQRTTAPLKAIFLGRIVPKKGLLLVLEALKSSTQPIELDIFGGAEDDPYVQECRDAAALAAPFVAIRFRGSVRPEAVRNTFAPYDVMLMPTAGENFGHVIAESLSASCPVICTATTPWTALLEAGAGRIVWSSSVKDWQKAIDGYSSLDADQRHDQRLAAGRLYETWRAEPKGPHVFELLGSKTRA